MNYWIIVSALLALVCALLIVIYRQQRAEILKLREERTRAAAPPPAPGREVTRLRGENARRAKQVEELSAELEQERARADALEDDLSRCEELITEVEGLLERAEKRRIEAEKGVSAGRMRTDLLEKELSQQKREQSNQEQIYQAMIRERDEAISKLQDQQRRRGRKKPAVLDQQVTLDDILKGA